MSEEVAARPRLRLRPTMLSDLDFVISVENDTQNLPFITPWERTQHEGAVRFPDFRHFIVEAGEAYESAGFVILQGCRNPHRSVELKPWQGFTVPRGMVHRTRAPERAVILMMETASIVPTGDA